MKPSSFRRLAAGIALAGAGALALLSGPAMAHEQNGNPDPTNPADPVNGRHDVTLSKANNLVRSKVDGCGFNFAPACETNDPRSNANDGSATAGDNMITNASAFFRPTDVARIIVSPTFADPTFITTYISPTSVLISGESGAPATVSGASFTVLSTAVTVTAPTFGGTPNAGVGIQLCNEKRATSTDSGGDGDIASACDFANVRGWSSFSGFPAASGTFTLDGSGNLTPGVGGVPASGIPLTPTSCSGVTGTLVPDLLTALFNANCSNSNATTTCPPTQAQIQNGWTCTMSVEEFDPTAVTLGAHRGFRVVNLKSPIPAKLCNNVACGMTLPAMTTVKLTGVRFPCKIIRPDDPAVSGNQGACVVAHADKTVLVKRVRTAHIELSITPTSQTASVNGDYTLTFSMPTVAHPTELYKLIPHAQPCPAPGFNQGSSLYGGTSSWIVKSCESGVANAAGSSFRQS